MRYQVTRWVNERTDAPFPVATLFINVSGAFLLGWFTRSLHVYFPQLHNIPILVLGVGLCGAYTTFSTFSYEIVSLLRSRLEWTAIAYLTISTVGGFAASALGLYGLPK